MNLQALSLPKRLSLGLAGLFLFLFFIYVRTLSPAWHPDDSGESIVASATLSTQHPPGYPLHSLLGRLAVVLGPGPASFNVNLLAAGLAALAMLLLAALAYSLGEDLAPWAQERKKRALVAALLALSAGLTQQHWFQAGIAKGGIYQLNLALSLGLLFLAIKAREALLLGRSSRQTMAGMGLLLGLGLANHWSSILALIPCMALLLAEAFYKRKSWPSMLEGVGPSLLMLMGLSLYLVLPLRQALDCPLQWGDLSQPGDLFWLFLRGQYAGLESGKTLGSFLRLLDQEGRQILQAWTGPGLLVLLAGWAVFLRRRPMLALSLLALPLSLGLAVAYKANPPSDSLFIIDPYLLPLHASLGLGLLGFQVWPTTRPHLAWALIPLVLGLGFTHWRSVDHSQDYLGYDYGNNVLHSLPEGALVLANGDANIASTLVFRVLGQRRQDLDLLPTAFLQQPWYLRLLAKRRPQLVLPTDILDPQSTVDALASANVLRPLMWTNMTDPAWAQNEHMVLRGLASFRIGKVSTQTLQWVKDQRIWSTFAMRGVFEPGALPLDPLSHRLVRQRYEESLARYGQAAHALGDWRLAAAEYRRLGILRPGWADAWLDAGSICFKHDKALAKAFWQRAVFEDPTSAQGWANLAVVALGSSQLDEAKQLAERALSLDPYFKMAQEVLNAIAQGPKL